MRSFWEKLGLGRAESPPVWELRPEAAADLAGALAQFEWLVGQARLIPLTPEVRLPEGDLLAALAQVRVTAEREARTSLETGDLGSRLIDLDRLVSQARLVPLTDQVRFSRSEALRLIEELRRLGG